MLPSWLTEPLWDQFAVLLPERAEFDPADLLGCHRRRIDDRIVFEKHDRRLRNPLGRVLAGANPHDSRLLAPTSISRRNVGRCRTRSPLTWAPATTAPPLAPP